MSEESVEGDEEDEDDESVESEDAGGVDDGALEELEELEDLVSGVESPFSMLSSRSSPGFGFTTGATFGILYVPVPQPASVTTPKTNVAPTMQRVLFIAAEARPRSLGEQEGLGVRRALPDATPSRWSRSKLAEQAGARGGAPPSTTGR